MTVLEESADRLYLVIPTADGAPSDLSDADLGAVAGGRADGTDDLGARGAETGFIGPLGC